MKIHNAGHVAMLERPEDVNAAIATLVARALAEPSEVAGLDDEDDEDGDLLAAGDNA